MKVKTQELKEILRGLQPGISQRKFVEQSAHYIFTGDRICSYNDRVSVSYPFVTDFQCSIPSESFYQVVSKLTSKEVQLELVDNQLRVTSSKVKSGFSSLLEGEVFDILSSLIIKGDWIPLPNDFLKGVELCLFSASTDQTQKFLSSICVRNKWVESSDDVRISCYSMEEGVPESFLLPVSSAKGLLGYNLVSYCINNGWVHFRLDSGGIFSSRIIAEEYPETQSFFNVKGRVVDLPSNLLNVIEIASVLSEGDYELDKQIKLIISESSIVCKGENECGWIEKVIPFSWEGDSISFSINPIFFKQILEKSTRMILSDDRALFKSKSFSHVMALQI
jgi:DNA polymerase III sliding clamp (beta) subunit (PCNA family)